MNQDLPEISGGEQTGIRWRGRTFCLWVGCVDENARLKDTERLPEAQAAAVQLAARAAAREAGCSEEEIETRQVITLYPFIRNEMLRAKSRAGMIEYIRLAPDKGTIFNWRVMAAQWAAQDAAERQGSGDRVQGTGQKPGKQRDRAAKEATNKRRDRRKIKKAAAVVAPAES